MFNNPQSPLTAMAFNSSGDLFELNVLGNINEITPSGGNTLIYNALGGALGLGGLCLACDSQGNLYVGCNNGDIIEFQSGGSQSTLSDLGGAVTGLAFEPVPEPSTWALFGVSTTMLLVRRCKKGCR